MERVSIDKDDLFKCRLSHVDRHSAHIVINNAITLLFSFEDSTINANANKDPLDLVISARELGFINDRGSADVEAMLKKLTLAIEPIISQAMVIMMARFHKNSLNKGMIQSSKTEELKPEMSAKRPVST